MVDTAAMDPTSAVPPTIVSSLMSDPGMRPSALVLLRFFQMQQQDGLHHVEAAELAGHHGVRDLVPPDTEVMYTCREPAVLTVLARGDDCAYYVRIGANAATISIAASTLDDAADRMSRVNGACLEHDEDRQIVSIWRSRGMTAFSDDRSLDCPRWTEIEANYAATTRGRLDALASSRPPSDVGRLILWHGCPGTGKTTAVRMLIRAWNPWCSAHYIADPERFFNDPNYILDMLTRPIRYDDGPGFDSEPENDRVRLIIGEDCDEYLTPAANQSAGPALSRLLNLSDGILGQGLNPIILLTTNEPISKLHPAVIRPGRCLDITEFLPLSPPEVSCWLGRPIATAHTLAEAFALRATRPTSQPQPQLAQPGHYL